MVWSKIVRWSFDWKTGMELADEHAIGPGLVDLQVSQGLVMD